MSSSVKPRAIRDLIMKILHLLNDENYEDVPVLSERTLNSINLHLLPIITRMLEEKEALAIFQGGDNLCPLFLRLINRSRLDLAQFRRFIEQRLHYRSFLFVVNPYAVRFAFDHRNFITIYDYRFHEFEFHVPSDFSFANYEHFGIEQVLADWLIKNPHDLDAWERVYPYTDRSLQAGPFGKHLFRNDPLKPVDIIPQDDAVPLNEP